MSNYYSKQIQFSNGWKLDIDELMNSMGKEEALKEMRRAIIHFQSKFRKDELERKYSDLSEVEKFCRNFPKMAGVALANYDRGKII